jgi:hypothetical protein
VSSRQRIVLLLVAAVVLVGGILLASSSGDDEGSDAQPATQNTTPSDTSADGTGGTEAPPETQAEEPPAPPPPRVDDIRMRGRAPVGEPKRLKYDSGDVIRLRFVSDVAEEVHVHGFDDYVQVPAGNKPKLYRTKADIEGIYEVEAHSSGELLAELEIRPK